MSCGAQIVALAVSCLWAGYAVWASYRAGRDAGQRRERALNDRIISQQQQVIAQQQPVIAALLGDGLSESKREDLSLWIRNNRDEVAE